MRALAEVDYTGPLAVAVRPAGSDVPDAIVRVALSLLNEAAGAIEVAKEVVHQCEQPNYFKFLYEDSVSLWDKMKAIATKIYGAADITADAAVRKQIQRLQEGGYGHYPVCVAKTQYSFSTDAQLRGAPSGHVINIREVRLAAGAEFIVMICGDIMTMPGLPKQPAAETIDVDEGGRVSGLF
jgi:formate--tetrahydrofolate ligase